MAELVTIKGLGEVVARFASARDEIPHAVNWALARAADEIRDVARSNVSGSQYKLSGESWKINSIMSRKNVFTSMVGYYIPKAAAAEGGKYWFIKFYEAGASNRVTTGNGKIMKIAGLSRGSIAGGHFMKDAGSNADSVATSKMNESIAYMLRKVGLT